MSCLIELHHEKTCFKHKCHQKLRTSIALAGTDQSFCFSLPKHCCINYIVKSFVKNCRSAGLSIPIQKTDLSINHFNCSFIPVRYPFIILSRLMGKPTICIDENKDADQLRGNREADQRLCFRYSDSTIPLLSKSEISSL